MGVWWESEIPIHHTGGSIEGKVEKKEPAIYYFLSHVWTGFSCPWSQVPHSLHCQDPPYRSSHPTLNRDAATGEHAKTKLQQPSVPSRIRPAPSSHSPNVTPSSSVQGSCVLYAL
ncbi:hypothetical protein PoB_006234200 [Plakobranchus ocellatus]|uniref:Uncharacterized protein n=1 Tax=Plakobranchus ocellatus TaxID=259542 RepID=A0AAV4CVA1_9GAST|nr:hypothetical protein PoB_006234200 [Plakobranchus ocellatus]